MRGRGGDKLRYKMARLILFRNKGPGIWLTRVLRFPRLSPATDMETEREKYFPGEALAGLLDTESCEPDRLRSSASPGTLVGMEQGLRVVCIFREAGQGVQ